MPVGDVNFNNQYVACGGNAYIRPSDCPPAANSHVIIWQSGVNRLSGLFLPSLRPFVIPVPGGVGVAEPPYQIVLSSRRLYVRNLHGQLWTAAAPSLPPHE
jgi:hypothetical protein